MTGYEQARAIWAQNRILIERAKIQGLKGLAAERLADRFTRKENISLEDFDAEVRQILIAKDRVAAGTSTVTEFCAALAHEWYIVRSWPENVQSWSHRLRTGDVIAPIGADKTGANVWGLNGRPTQEASCVAAAHYLLTVGRAQRGKGDEIIIV